MSEEEKKLLEQHIAKRGNGNTNNFIFEDLTRNYC